MYPRMPRTKGLPDMGGEPIDPMGADDGVPDMTHEDLAQSVAHHKAIPIHHARKVVSEMMHPKLRKVAGVRIRKGY